ncbi:MAG: hypothetical protein JWM11_6931 [Planctomycetaceae bacterium]|nr:hypothetical protein [Planctomycetaceae bacterium]
MTYQEALEQLVTWLDESLGAPIAMPSGQTRGLRLTQDYTQDEIEDFEDEWDLDFPAPYRQFLLTVGACELFYGGAGRGRGVSISRLDSIPELFHEYFDRDNSLLFEQYLPIGGVYGQQQVAAFDIERDDPQNFALFSDEQQATDWSKWAETTNPWQSFEDWIIEMVQTEGEFAERA